MFSRLRKINTISRGAAAISRNLSDAGDGRRTLKVPLRRKAPVKPQSRTRTPAPLVAQDPWTEVLDKESGQIYYWNTVTDETTALGAPKPNGPGGQQLTAEQAPQQGGSMMGGLGRVVAEGFAFGVGSSVAHSMVGSMFGGSHGSNDAPADTSGGDDDSFDI